MYEKLLKECQHAEEKFIEEAVQSAKLAKLAKDAGDPELLKKIFATTKLQLDKIPDDKIKYADLEKARAGVEGGAEAEYLWKQENAINQALRDSGVQTWSGRRGGDLIFWVLKKEKKSPSKQALKAGLLAVTQGDSVLFNAPGYTETWDKKEVGPRFTGQGKGTTSTAPRGMGSMERLKLYADEAYGIDTYSLSRGEYDYKTKQTTGKYDAEPLQQKRKEARAGALALKDPADIAKWNRERYAEIIAKKNPSPELKATAEELNSLTKKAIDALDVSKMEGGKARVSGYKDKRGKAVSIKSFLSYVEKAWEKLNYAQDAWAEFKQNPEYKHAKDNYDGYVKAAKAVVEEIKSGVLDVYWND